ncbi:MAG: tetratricopeptide repeat protein [Rhizomicrobium sp.]
MQTPDSHARIEVPVELLAAIDRAEQGGDGAAAVALAQRAIESGYVHPRLFDLRGRWMRDRGRLREALDDLQRAHTLAPKTVSILVALAACLNDLGRHKQALLAAGDARAIDPACPGAWLQKGIAHRRLEQRDRARACFAEAVRLDPGMSDAKAQLAELGAAPSP